MNQFLVILLTGFPTGMVLLQPVSPEYSVRLDAGICVYSFRRKYSEFEPLPLFKVIDLCINRPVIRQVI